MFNKLNILGIKVLVVFWKLIGAGIAAISLIGSGVGIGIVFGSLILASSRDRISDADLFNYSIMGFAFTESIALFGLMMAFLLLYGDFYPDFSQVI